METQLNTFYDIKSCYACTLMQQIIRREQARSQDLEKGGGGLFWKSEKCANDLDSNFHWSWINFRRFARNLGRNVSESSEIQRFFPPQIRWSPKKKSSSPKFGVIFRPKSEIQRFFPPKIRWSPKKKKKKGCYFVQFRKFRRLRGGCFRMGGGAIFHFSHKIGLKSTKSMRFCILHKPMGEARAPTAPPPPGNATGREQIGN